jgi:hypothetical protein
MTQKSRANPEERDETQERPPPSGLEHGRSVLLPSRISRLRKDLRGSVEEAAERADPTHGESDSVCSRAKRFPSLSLNIDHHPNGC